jgi:hypothetical protein
MMKFLVLITLVLQSIAASYAELMKIDNRFIQDKGERNIRGWSFNAAECYKPFGEVSSQMMNGEAGVKLVSKGKLTTIYLNDRLSVKAGDVFTITANVCGMGRGTIGVFQYADKWKWMGSQGDTFKVAGTNLIPVVQKIIIPEGVLFIRPSISSVAGEISVFGYKIEKNN